MKAINRVGIVGAGTMGRRIAFGCVVRGVEARLYDAVPTVAAEAMKAVRQLIAEREADGRLPAGTLEPALARLSTASTLAGCVDGCELVVECVPEDVELKRRVFAEIDRHAGPDALLATNTSSIPGSWLADAVRRPERLFNVNFGHADHRKVEVMGHPGTAPETLDAAVAVLRRLGLVPIRVRGEVVGYATNRVWRAVKKEVLFLLDRGYVTPEDVDRAWMLDWGTPIGPCGLMDKIGLDVVRDIELIYYRATGDPSDRPPQLLLDLIAQGKLGVKSGAGFYTYPNPAYQQPGWVTGEE